MKSFNLRASTEDIEEAEGMTGEFVRFEDHERELARYKGAVKDWASKWERTDAELVAHKAMSAKVISDLGAAMTAAAERMKELEGVRERYQAEDDVLAAAEAWFDGWLGAAEPSRLDRTERALFDALAALRKVKP